MGVYFQVQDDYLDCYGTPEQIGKIGTDIQDSKCSWLVVKALGKANKEQRARLLANYGKDTEENISAVKALYRELQLEKDFEAYEQASYEKLNKLIENEVRTVPKEVYTRLLSKIYKRSK